MPDLLLFCFNNVETATQIAVAAMLTNKVPIELATASTGIPAIQSPATNDSSNSHLEAISNHMSGDIAFA